MSLISSIVSKINDMHNNPKHEDKLTKKTIKYIDQINKNIVGSETFGYLKNTVH